mmetsp:Transcript_28492/g.45773  ORF Transcript_28492/g.45773 Transcript_28492/m.45773 type:complete len:342 (-) Transcript_28492:69-1094(-)
MVSHLPARVALAIIYVSFHTAQVGAFMPPASAVAWRHLGQARAGKSTGIKRPCLRERATFRGLLRGRVCMVSEDLQSILDGTLEEGLARSAWEGKTPAIEQFGMQVMHKSPPLFRIPNFLTPDECDMLIHEAISTGEEATEYLNARVNSEVKGGGAGTMPERATGYSAEAANEAVEWSAGATSGLRRRLSRDALRMLDARVLAVLGEVATGREIEMIEAVYERPDARRVIVRDATVVHYVGGEGVAPHIDGKDATLLCYLNDVPVNCGGRTVFPEVKVASVPQRGHALLYDSRKDLLHFAEPVADGHEKWVMQLLIDFRYVPQPGGMHVDFKTGKVSYDTT